MGKLIECLRGREKFVILFGGASGWLNISSLISPSRLSSYSRRRKKRFTNSSQPSRFSKSKICQHIKRFSDATKNEVRALGSHEWVDKAINHLVSDGFVRITPEGGD